MINCANPRIIVFTQFQYYKKETDKNWMLIYFSTQKNGFSSWFYESNMIHIDQRKKISMTLYITKKFNENMEKYVIKVIFSRKLLTYLHTK